MSKDDINELISLMNGSVKVTEGKIEILDEVGLRKNIHKLAEVSAFESGSQQGTARFLTRMIGQAFGTYPASINDLYMARGRGDVPASFTVPAINLRAMAYDSARAVFRAALSMNAGAMIFEIARSEMTYTDQRPSEYVTSILAAAITEGYKGPVFIQGDHFQVSAKRYNADPDAEIQALRELTQEAVTAGFLNIDIDTSTMVDLSKTTISEQQALNTGLSALLTSYVRSIEPEGVTVSVGGEIGEVGGHNSNEQELRAYMDGYLTELENFAPGKTGISKISIQTGTSHGGVVLPDGTIAKVSVDFDTLLKLSRLARLEYGISGAVQHGASTLPEDAFGKFVECEASEVHLATNFQNMLFERLPANLVNEMYSYLDEKFAAERKPDMTDEQFYYKTRKNVIGPYKKELWNLPDADKKNIGDAWEKQFTKLFNSLGVAGTRAYVNQTIRTRMVTPKLKDYLGEGAGAEDVSDLAD